MTCCWRFPIVFIDYFRFQLPHKFVGFSQLSLKLKDFFSDRLNEHFDACLFLVISDTLGIGKTATSIKIDKSCQKSLLALLIYGVFSVFAARLVAIRKI